MDELPSELTGERAAVGTDSGLVSTASLSEISLTARPIPWDVATSKLASDLSSGSKKPEPDSSAPVSEIYSWASRLASESRKLDWVFYRYVWPDVVREVIRKLKQ